jgi:1,2-dihydroxy-3-keto-5-methylthiopentene dioxygenase
MDSLIKPSLELRANLKEEHRMAKLNVPDQGRTLTDPVEINEFLRPFGIQYERWEASRPVGPDASSDQILEAYKPEIDRLKERGGYVTADVINVTAETPGLDAMLNKFNKEHTHSEDEVRFIVKGSGVFHINPKSPDGSTGPVFGIEMEAGDLINVPAGTQHWFDLCADRNIRAIRLFLDQSGWTPYYVENGVHERYAPLCWGPQYIATGGLRVQPITV